MPATPVLARPPSPRVSSPSSRVAITVVVGVAVALFAIVSRPLGDPVRTDLTVENPTEYLLNVMVSPADGGNRLIIGAVAPKSTKSWVGVLDQGDRWRVSFSYGGIDAGSTEVLGSAIGEMPVEVPATVGDTLRDAGAAVPAP